MDKIEQINKIKSELFVLKDSPLYEYRVSNNYLPVTGEGSCDSQIMFIEEAPGRNEAKSGKPFCGAAGKIFDKILEQIQINRDSVYVTNIIKDRPPKNRDPLPIEIKIYGPFLDRQIDIIKPKVIVTLGRYAMKYIMEKFNLKDQIEPIGKAHGKSYRASATYGEIYIVALYHPCVAVYNPHNLDDLKKDALILKTILQN